MKFFTTQSQAQLFYKDLGEGSPVILIHGWPLSADMWDEQTLALLDAGYRVISYDRRGFGRSEQPASGYDYDTFANDLNDLITHLNLDKVSLVGFSMGGGEIARYLSRYGSQNVACTALLAAITPIVMKTNDNPNGVPVNALAEMKNGVSKDRFAFFRTFFKDFYGVGLMSQPVSEPTLAWAEMVASQASLKATLDCIDAFGTTDFRPDMKSFSIPTLIIHGTADKTVPIETSGEQAAQMIPGVIYKPYEGAPHGLNITHKKQLNTDLVEFLNMNAPKIIGHIIKQPVHKNNAAPAPQRH